MKRVLLGLLLLVLSVYTNAQELESTGIKFELPDGYVLLSKNEIERNWRFVNGSMKAYGNQNSNSAISMKLESIDLSNFKLEEVRVAYQEYYDSMMPYIDWKESSVKDINGVQWVYLELLFNYENTNVLNAFLIRPYEKSVAIINFNSTSETTVPNTDDFTKFMSSVRQ
tara:strand:+ start:3335 stop:3841 length:507 start_codon:yes stop_codon:yes gene_type:complete